MLYREDEAKTVGSLSAEQLDDLRMRILAERDVYGATEQGIDALCRIIVSAGIFDKADPNDTASAGTRNFVIDLMDSMGLVTEENLHSLVRFMLESPLPFMHEKETGSDDRS